ncbi:MAG: AAA family ATPase, partial [bacterium]
MPKHKKISRFFKLHRAKIILLTIALVFLIFLLSSLIVGLKEWGYVDAITKQHTIAALPFQIYLAFFQVFLFGLMWLFLMSKGGGAEAFVNKFTSLGKKPVKGEEIGIYWSDIIGMEEPKKEAMEVVQLIRDRADVTKSGTSILGGVLLLGPPGCGKTYMVKAIATESNIPFLSMSGSEFTEMFVGVGSARVRKLFQRARELNEEEGGCIIFIDEVDAIGFTRTQDLGHG